MARKKKNRKKRAHHRPEVPPARRPAAPEPPAPGQSGERAPRVPGGPSPVERLRALRQRMLAGDVDGALNEVDDWLTELGAPPTPEGVPRPEREEEPEPRREAEVPDAEQIVAPEHAPRAATPPREGDPRVAVLMMTYDRAHLIEPAIDSVLAQTWQDFDFIICDDGSTDDTPAVVGGYADPRLRYVRKELNEGRSKTRNRLVTESAEYDYVLWMADDDEIAPDTLQGYIEALRERPELDVLYGNLEIFDSDTGRVLNTYEPNDWTGREERLLGGKLWGSCIPDGGSLVRRALYDRYGAYDPEFVRAQDYEFWTRVAHDIKVKKLDQVVYRYRKHDGNVSFGDFVDLTYDSKIIRRLLTRHPLERLFPTLDWSQPESARARAWLRLCKALRVYQDAYNAERFVAATPRWRFDPEACQALFDARLARGDLDGCADVVDGFVSARHHAVRDRLEATLAEARSLRGRADALLEQGKARDIDPVLTQLEQLSEEPTFDATWYRTRALEAVGRDEEALRFACQAVRLDPTHDDAFAAARRLRERLEASGPKVDVEAMRERLLEAIYPLDAPAEGPVTDGPRVTGVLLADEGGEGLRVSLESARRQTWTDFEIVVVGGAAAGEVTDGLDDDRVRTVPAEGELGALARAALGAAGAPWIAWLVEGAVWDPDHVARLMARREESQVVFAEARRDRLAIDTVEETFIPTLHRFDRARLLAAEAIPLSATLTARAAVEPEAFDDTLGRRAGWAALVELSRDHEFAHEHFTTCAVPLVEPAAAEGPAPARRRALQRIYRRYARDTLFDTAARKLQNRELARFGVSQALRGLDSVVVVAAGLEQTRRCVEALRERTWVPWHLVVVADGPDDALAEWLRALPESLPGTKIVVNARELGGPKALNQGLSKANGECVALVRADVEVSDGWLGRLRWWVERTPERGLVVAADEAEVAEPEAHARAHWGQSALLERFDDRCLLVTRGVLDRVGGFDTALGSRAVAMEDWCLRAHLAGFTAVEARDVPVNGPRIATQPDAEDLDRFRRRWEGDPPADAEGRAARLAAHPGWDRARHFVSFGAEPGFRPDTRPLQVLEAGERNVLVVPPDDDAALAALLPALADAPSATWWLRAEPGEGQPTLERLERLAGEAGLDLEALPEVLVVDAFLAPEREAALYVAADAVFVDDAWPDADVEVRRATDCGRPVLRGGDALRAWLADA